MIRQAAAKASAAKIDALLMSRAKDMRAHDLFQWHAASTGRWAGRRFQPHNLMRPTIGKKGIQLACRLIREHRDPEILNHVFGDDEALSVVGNIIRSLVIAAPGKKLYCGDFSNIEGRGLAWEAGEETKLDVFRLNDAKLGPDPYLVAAAAIKGVPIETLTKDSPERQIGKVAELACGYQGSKGAFYAMAGAYGLVLPEAQVIAAVDGWRNAHPKTVEFWHNVERAAVDAVLDPGRWNERIREAASCDVICVGSGIACAPNRLSRQAARCLLGNKSSIHLSELFCRPGNYPVFLSLPEGSASCSRMRLAVSRSGILMRSQMDQTPSGSRGLRIRIPTGSHIIHPCKSAVRA
jgi:hypothetical protein